MASQVQAFGPISTEEATKSGFAPFPSVARGFAETSIKRSIIRRTLLIT
jgi:hypothetical protein